jgi:hypothetical protein
VDMRWMVKSIAQSGRLIGEVHLPDGYNPSGNVISCRGKPDKPRWLVASAEPFYDESAADPRPNQFAGILWVKLPIGSDSPT